MIGISVTVLILGNADQYLKKEIEKRRLILQMGSPDNGFAREVLRQLDEMGLLQKGILYGADLSGANLSGAVLQSIEFPNTNLRHAILRETNFHLCDFSNSYVEGANLEKAYLEE
jgi:uncharacterized protein YjbI with pentapeptide repeats